MLPIAPLCQQIVKYKTEINLILGFDFLGAGPTEKIKVKKADCCGRKILTKLLSFKENW